MKTQDEILEEIKADPAFQALNSVSQHLCSYPAVIAWLEVALKLSKTKPKEVEQAFEIQQFRKDFRPIYKRILNL